MLLSALLPPVSYRRGTREEHAEQENGFDMWPTGGANDKRVAVVVRPSLDVPLQVCVPCY